MEMLPVRRMDQARLAVERSTGANCRRQRRRPHRRCSWCTASRLRSHSSRRIARPVGLHDLLPPSPTDIRITLAQSLFTDILLPLQLIIALLYAPLHTICREQPRLPAAMLNRAEYNRLMPVSGFIGASFSSFTIYRNLTPRSFSIQQLDFRNLSLQGGTENNYVHVCVREIKTRRCTARWPLRYAAVPAN